MGMGVSVVLCESVGCVGCVDSVFFFFVVETNVNVAQYRWHTTWHTISLAHIPHVHVVFCHGSCTTLWWTMSTQGSSC